MPTGVFDEAGEGRGGRTTGALTGVHAAQSGALVLNLPLVATIAVITLVAAFVPHVGAWVPAIFAVVVAFGAGGVSTGLRMLAIVVVTRNLLEGLVRHYIFGGALGLHPMVALTATTILGAALAGVSGAFIAPPVAAIVVLELAYTVKADGYNVRGGQGVGMVVAERPPGSGEGVFAVLAGLVIGAELDERPKEDGCRSQGARVVRSEVVAPGAVEVIGQ